MYKIFADDTLIYDSTIEDYKISKGIVTLETNKSGSFVLGVYPDHFYYDKFIRLKTIIKVCRDNEIIFRGRILNDITDFKNNKVITCEGELGFLRDSIIRPFDFTGTPEEFLRKIVEEHNAQVDPFKRFNVGKVTVVDPNNKIARSNSLYESAISNLNSRLIEDSLGGYFYITRGTTKSETIPTLNYLAKFEKVSTQRIEFGSNLKDYTKKVTANEIATAIIPLGAEIDDGISSTPNKRVTIEKINEGKDYVFDQTAVNLYGYIFKVEEWPDVSKPENLKKKAEERLKKLINQNITIELNAIDLHLLDRSIESFNVCENVKVISKPHNFNEVLLCNKQVLDLLKPDNDSLTLGYTFSTFTESTGKVSSIVSTVTSIKDSVSKVNNSAVKAQADADKALNNYNEMSNNVTIISKDVESLATAITTNNTNIQTNAKNIATNATNIATNASNIKTIQGEVEALKTNYTTLDTSVSGNTKSIADLTKAVETTNTNVGNNSKSIATNTKNIGDNTKKITGITTELATEKEKISTLETKATTLETKATDLETSVSDILKRLDALEATNKPSTGGGGVV